ncbi:hypothetical protein E4U13_004748 [Claviceps humidiphila]|uniref:Uncharacterized protein n=1 Tax=Claviceps humidiphila TaxID=1294629 RepID=A0A9P7TVK0_9HYPO|nr:hypothetical protein E4U13_004748 [Claviceps humidiphila]
MAVDSRPVSAMQLLLALEEFKKSGVGRFESHVPSYDEESRLQTSGGHMYGCRRPGAPNSTLELSWGHGGMAHGLSLNF